MGRKRKIPEGLVQAMGCISHNGEEGRGGVKEGEGSTKTLQIYLVFQYLEFLFSYLFQRFVYLLH